MTLKPKNKIKNKTQKYRFETDILGKVSIPSNHLWGISTQRSLTYFSIGTEHIPLEFIYRYVLFKKCAAKVNYTLKKLDIDKYNAITSACNDILKRQYDSEFPLHIWQTGSGTQTNMNVNEVISGICKLHGVVVDSHDHVNMSQSSNDSFISVMHIFVAIKVKFTLLQNLQYMIHAFKKKQEEFKHDLKIGRTHLEDAIPLTFGQEFSGYVALLKDSFTKINQSLSHVYQLASGGTAVGTGFKSPPTFGKHIASELAKVTNLSFITAPNKFSELSSHNAILEMSDSFKVLATNIMKIANDIRWMGSGPAAGLHELLLPQNELGSSIMPGKINPTQCEAACMVSIQVIANNVAITMANTQGNFELNVYNPLMLYNISQSIHLLSDVCINFTKFCILGLKINKKKVNTYLNTANVIDPNMEYNTATKLLYKK